MFGNRYSKILTGLLIFVIASVSVNFATHPSKVAVSQPGAARSGSGTYLPLPPGKQTQLFNAARRARILYHRNSNANWSASAIAYSDYAQRHPELSSLAVLGQGASDYAERHPELSMPRNHERDTSDYFLRHPELSAKPAASIDLTDYYFRHIND